MLGNFALSLLAFATAITAAPLDERQAGPSVRVANGTIVGTTANGIDSFRGIPFAEPPLGALRLKPPVTYNRQYPGGTFQATQMGAACPQFALQTNTSSLPNDVLALLANSPLFQGIFNAKEDCLNINVQRPAGISPDAKLPVVYWIFGGGFELGSAGMYDATKFLQEGISGLARGNPVVYVSVNYRVGGFGFLAGRELQADGSTNLGLRDQRLGLQWVAENIAAFGGDPDKVTIWGESAGAISVLDQTIINGGDNTYRGKPLFRGAILNSGSIVPAEPVDTSKAQVVFDTVSSNAGCGGATDKLACLRALPFQRFFDATTTVPNIFSYRSLDLAYLPRPDPANSFFSQSPDIAISRGLFAKVPVICGSQEDEGTLFSLTTSNISNTAELTTYLQSYFPIRGRDLIPGLVATYPDLQSTGSPFRTGILNTIYPEFKRLAAILGDITFTLTRRSYLTRIAPHVPVWSYLDSHLYGTPILGTFHASDVLEAYFELPNAVPATTYQTYYHSFINFLDPNVITTRAPLIAWPRYTNEARRLLQLQTFTNNLATDDFRQASFEYIDGAFGGLRI
ncbi:putative extracellular lipase [Elsinoe ampelina]|uniref:Carboxylic ester hydrolase n=1 Tax=Elsinoe ampelina TaxID=302913 RepID=A0A6A6GCD1_9PEZI|nr:putative extracellular lipase [Elsinoe ampelina]